MSPKTDSQTYKRRTLQETEVIARDLYQSEMKEHLTDEEIKQLEKDMLSFRVGVGSSSPLSINWSSFLNQPVDEKDFHEFVVRELQGVGDRVWVAILVSRDRKSDFCRAIWKPNWRSDA